MTEDSSTYDDVVGRFSVIEQVCDEKRKIVFLFFIRLTARARALVSYIYDVAELTFIRRFIPFDLHE